MNALQSLTQPEVSALVRQNVTVGNRDIRTGTGRQVASLVPPSALFPARVNEPDSPSRLAEPEHLHINALHLRAADIAERRLRQQFGASLQLSVVPNERAASVCVADSRTTRAGASFSRTQRRRARQHCGVGR